MPGATFWVYLPASGRRRAAPKPAPPGRPDPARWETGPGPLPEGLGQGGPHGPTPRVCERSSAVQSLRGHRREGGVREPRRPGQTRDARGAEAVLLESRSSRLARPSHAATSGPPRLSDVRAHTPRAHGGPPGAPEVPPDLPSAPRPSPIGTPPYRGHRPRPLTHRRLQTPDTDTGHRPRARAAAEGAWGGRARPEPRRRRGPPPTPLSPAPSALPPRYRAPPPNTHPVSLASPFWPSLTHPRTYQALRALRRLTQATPRPLGPPEAVGAGREGKAEVPASGTDWLDKHSG